MGKLTQRDIITPQASMDRKESSMPRRPATKLNGLETGDDKSSPRLPNTQNTDGVHLFKPQDEGDSQPPAKTLWGNAKPPSVEEMAWIESFGRYPKVDPSKGNLSKRVTLAVADLKQATRIIVFYHYLHRGRTMAQLPYWILLDEIPVGVILYSLPRLSVPLDGVAPMNILELARIWISPDVQGIQTVGSDGRKHSFSVATCAVGRSLRTVQQDWYAKYPHMPGINAVVSWADTVHHEGTIYRAANFVESGISGGSMHGNRVRKGGGRDQWNPDYAHVKTRFLYRFDGPLTDKEKERIKKKTAGPQKTFAF
jgi:hypothetical protein